MEEQAQSRNEPSKNRAVAISIVAAALIIAVAWVYNSGKNRLSVNQPLENQEALTEEAVFSGDEVLKFSGDVLPVKWGDLGKKMVSAGVIDPQKFESVLSKEELNDETRGLLYGADNGYLKITQANVGVILNLLWALGLGNKNEILEKGEMTDSRYGDAGNFASTGGWTVARGNAMDHYSRHSLVTLTSEQQKLVERVSKNIYRPCCDNSTHFPDCNHGMAMLGLLELMASQNVSENDMYRAALVVNSYWFPENYSNIARYLDQQGILWSDVDAKQVLGRDLSSISGYRRMLPQIKNILSPKKNSGGCSV